MGIGTAEGVNLAAGGPKIARLVASWAGSARLGARVGVVGVLRALVACSRPLGCMVRGGTWGALLTLALGVIRVLARPALLAARCAGLHRDPAIGASEAGCSPAVRELAYRAWLAVVQPPNISEVAGAAFDALARLAVLGGACCAVGAFGGVGRAGLADVASQAFGFASHAVVAARLARHAAGAACLGLVHAGGALLARREPGVRGKNANWRGSHAGGQSVRCRDVCINCWPGLVVHIRPGLVVAGGAGDALLLPSGLNELARGAGVADGHAVLVSVGALGARVAIG